MTKDDAITELKDGQEFFREAIGEIKFTQKVMSKDIAELVVHTKEQNGRISGLETTAIQTNAVLNTLKYLIPVGLTFAGILSGVIFGIVQLIAS